MSKQIVIAEQLRIAALLTDERVDELIVAQGRYQIGDVYLGTVENVLPGIDAAFVNIGEESEKNGFLPVKDLGPLRRKKTASSITELLEPNQKVLVQIVKEPTGNKGPTLTGNLTLPGRYLVLQPYGQGELVKISQRIQGEGERNRLRALGVLIKPPGAGLLIRTEADGINEDLLIDDLEGLLKQWELIKQAAETASAPILLNRDDDFITRVLRDHLGADLVRVVVDNNSAIDRVSNFLNQDGPNVLVEVHTEPTDLLDHFRVNSAIRDALKPRVDLPSGGYIIIEPTEALTVIDVNSGSYRAANAQETVLWTNCDAAVEIARQLKLRNIGGVIIIDFIDMDSRRDQLQLLEHFTSVLRDDSSRPQIAQLTELGLVELTRKRQGQNIYELFGNSCQNCGGLGHVAVLPGKELIQPLASGLVRATSSLKPEANVPIENNHSRRRKPFKGRTSGDTSISNDSSVVSVDQLSTSQDPQEEVSPSESTNHRQEPELIAVHMSPEQEEVFGWLGLDPALLLETPPNNDNLLVRIVRPGDSEERVLDEAKKQIAAGSVKRRRRGRGINRIINRGAIESSADTVETLDQSLEEDQNKTNSTVEITPKETLDENINTEEAAPPSEEDIDIAIEDPRRRRRRSSAVN